MKFTAIDGEGQTDSDGRHRYVMLSIGAVTLSVNDGKQRECHQGDGLIHGNIISVPAGSLNVSYYYHPACYYRSTGNT
jgi:hypothetical protein